MLPNMALLESVQRIPKSLYFFIQALMGLSDLGYMEPVKSAILWPFLYLSHIISLPQFFPLCYLSVFFLSYKGSTPQAQ